MRAYSIFTKTPPDAAAFVFTPEHFGANPNGGDNTAALQAAIDRLEAEQKHGIIFIPEGRYCFSQTVQIWRGIRIIGVGEKRPVFYLADHTPGFEGPESRYLFHFRDFKPAAGQELRDAQNTTFYSGIRNIDIDLGNGNHGAVAARFRVAQLSSLEDMVFRLNDAKAGVEMAGNEIERCHFFGGEYGILTGETVAYWQFYLGDCVFDGQKSACISSYRAGLTMVRDTMKNAPYGVYVPNKEEDNHYIEEFERLYMADCWMENLTKAGVSMNMIRYPQNWFHARDTICKNVPMFFDSFAYQYNKHIAVKPVCADHEVYRVTLDMGLQIKVDNEQSERGFDMAYTLTPLAEYTDAPAPDYTAMPEQADWVNVRDCGVAGDGITDDTAALQKAVNEHTTLYLPMGRYLISDTITLKEDTCIIGLHCAKTMLVVADQTEGFASREHPKPVLLIPQGGRNHLCGLGFDGGINPGLTSLEWLGAPDSLAEDLFFTHGQGGVKGRNRCHSILVRDGGAGVFKNIWSPDTGTLDGLHIRNTHAPGQIYLMSVEHHADIECVFSNVANWKIVSLQTEENLGSEYASSLFLKDCFDLVFYNLFQYRVQAINIPHPYASHAIKCKNLVVNGVHVFSIGPTPFTDAWRIGDRTFVRDHEIGKLIINT